MYCHFFSVHSVDIITGRINAAGNVIAYVRSSVRPFVSTVSSEPTDVDLELCISAVRNCSVVLVQVARPMHSNDVAYCYRCSVVCLSVVLSVGDIVEVAKND